MQANPFPTNSGKRLLNAESGRWKLRGQWLKGVGYVIKWPKGKVFSQVANL